MKKDEDSRVAAAGRTDAPRVRRDRQVSRDAPAPTPSSAGERVSAFFRTYAGDVRRSRAGLVRQVPAALAAARAARALPVLTLDVSAAPEGELIRSGLAHLGRRTARTAFVRTSLHEVASVLVLPETPLQYTSGSSKQTVRRKSRAAEKAGVRWARVEDAAERRALVALTEEREREHPQARYRADRVDNARLLAIDLWLVAYSAGDVPLLVCVVPTDGDWALLTYFRTLDDSTAASDARYLMSAVLAEELVGRGVRYLADTLTMSNLPDGLRHFQHMLGYQAVRVRLGPRRRSPDEVQQAGPPVVASSGTGPGSEDRSHPAGSDGPVLATTVISRRTGDAAAARLRA